MGQVLQLGLFRTRSQWGRRLAFKISGWRLECIWTNMKTQHTKCPCSVIVKSLKIPKCENVWSPVNNLMQMWPQHVFVLRWEQTDAPKHQFEQFEVEIATLHIAAHLLHALQKIFHQHRRKYRRCCWV